MKVKKIPMRMCIVTKERVEKRNLLRIVKTPDGVIVDPSGKINGHGVYIKKDLDVLDKAKQTKVLDRIFEANISDEVYESAKKIIEEI